MCDKSDGRVLLYEGNLPEWQKQISKAFIAQGRSDIAYPAVVHPTSPSSPTTYHRSSFGDAQIILSSISANMLLRIPYDLDLVGPLYAWLEKLCTPLRIFDLPPELRINIFEEVLASNPSQGIGIPSYGHPQSPLPALVHTNRQLRKEA